MRAVVILMLMFPMRGLAKAPPRVEAQNHYNAGVAHYKAGEYGPAADEFEAAIALRPVPQWLFNLASAYRAAKNPDKALENYRKYLDAVPDAANRAQVEQRIAEAQREIDARAPAPEPVRAPPAAQPVVVEPPAPPPKAKPKGPKTPYEIGYRIRYLFVTNAMFAPYLDAATQMNSWSQGVEFVYHRRTFDVVTSLDFSWLPVDDGNYLSAGHDPSMDSHYTQFRNLSFLSADVSIIGHFDVTSWLQIRAGAGLGVGVVFGDVLLTNDSTSCTRQNVSNFNACHPAGIDPAKPIEPQLQATQSNPNPDTAVSPKRHVSSDKPPAMAVLNILAAARFKLPQHFSLDVELGFRDAMFVGVGTHYQF